MSARASNLRGRQSSRFRGRGYPTRWSDWEWNEQYQRDARYRQINEDSWEWEYAEASLGTTKAEPIPEGALRGEALGTPHAAEDFVEYAGSRDTYSGDGKGVLCSSCSMTFLRSSELERHHKTVHSNNGARPYQCDFNDCPADVKSWTTAAKLRLHKKHWHGPYGCANIGCSRCSPNGFQSQQELDSHFKEAHSGSSNPDEISTVAENISCSSTKRSEYTSWSDWEWEEGPQRWRRYRQDSHGHYEYEYDSHTSGTQFHESSNAVPRYKSVAQSTPSAYAQDSSKSYAMYQSPLGSSASTIYEAQPLEISYPSASSSGFPSIVSRLGTLSIPSQSYSQQADQLDPRFSIRGQPSRFFQIGRVFKVLWTEPAVETTNDLDTWTMHRVAFGELASSKIRRFVVIRKRLHCCLCLPILTYEGQGATMAGVRASDHAIVYDANEAEPKEAPGELLGKHALRIIVEEQGETLDSMSRIDFGKVYTVQHSIKVMNVGRIEKLDLRYLKRNYNESMRIDSDDDNY